VTFRRVPPVPPLDRGIEHTLVAWAKETVQAWSELPEKPGNPGEEWRIEAKRDVAMVLDAQREIAKLRARVDELAELTPRQRIAELCFAVLEGSGHLLDATTVYYWGRVLETANAVPPSHMAFRQWIFQHDPKYRGGVYVNCVIPAEWKVGAA
jgi:hypothetical protein